MIETLTVYKYVKSKKKDKFIIKTRGFDALLDKMSENDHIKLDI